MKTTIYLLGTVFSLFVANAFANENTNTITTNNNGSDITITGFVRDKTCTVDSNDLTVELIDGATKQLSSFGTTTLATPFSIVLSSCSPSITGVKVTFIGLHDDDNNHLLKIDADSSTSTGTGVQILNEQKNELPINVASSVIPISEQQSNTLTFYARLMATQVPVKSGLIHATATFNIEFQ